MKANSQTLGPQLRGKRIARGFSLRKLAKRSGVSHSMIDRIEKNDCDPRVGDCEKLCKAMRIQITIHP